MSIRDFERHLPCASTRASPCGTAVSGGAVLRVCAGILAWQDAGNGMNDGGGRVSAARSAMR